MNITNRYYLIEQSILDGTEKRYLEGLLKPFKNKFSYAIKLSVSDVEYIYLYMKNSEQIEFPCFEKGTMYKGMELNKGYTLEKLGLFEKE